MESIKGKSFSSTVFLVLLIVAVFITVLLHELGHALMARRFGSTTQDITLLPIGGMARMDRIPEVAGQEIAVALAGPAVNLLIAGAVFLGLYYSRGHISGFNGKELNVHNWLDHFMYANLFLALFNLIPAFPMDGGRVFRGILSYRQSRVKATVIAARTGQIIAGGMIVVGFWGNPILVLIGVFIFIAAQAEASGTSAQAILHGATVSDVMIHTVEMVQATSTLRQAVNQLLDTQATKFVVIKEGAPVGYLARQLLFDEIEKNGQDVFIEACMSRDLLFVKSGDPLDTLYARMQSSPAVPLALVLSGNGIHGYVDLDNILEFVLYRKALQRNAAHASHA